MPDTDHIREGFLRSLRRRQRPALIAVAAIFGIAALLALFMPPVYRSTATILIEKQDIPPELVRSSITSFASERIATIRQQVMTRTNLQGIIDKHGLYKNQRGSETIEEVIQRMRDDIAVETIRAEVIDPRSGVPGEATIAFTLSYDYSEPALAQRVADELSSLFLSENLRTRSEKAEQASRFLGEEADRLAAQVATLETEIATYKEKNLGRLPQQEDLNTQILNRTEQELNEADGQIRELESRKIYLEAQLAQVNPNSPSFSASGERILDASSRLKTLRTNYTSLLARYSPDHPDVIQTRREIAALAQETGETSATDEQSKQLVAMRGELAQLQKRYAADHPDVVKLKKSVAALEEALRADPVIPIESQVGAQKPENPAYLTLRSQMDAAEGELLTWRNQRETLKNKIADYEVRLAETPEIERELTNMTREYANTIDKYRDIKNKQLEAEVSQQLEQERRGERFTLIDSPQFPEEPVSPNRPLILFVGLTLSLGGGLGYATVMEGMDRSVRGGRGVLALTQAPPLAVIPYMENSEDRRRGARAKLWGLIGIGLLFVVLLVVIHIFWGPLDVLWFKAMRRLGALFGASG